MKDYFSPLNKYLVIEIFLHLDLHSISYLSKCNKKLKEIFGNEKFWQSLCERDIDKEEIRLIPKNYSFISFYKAFHNTKRKDIDSLTMKMIVAILLEKGPSEIENLKINTFSKILLTNHLMMSKQVFTKCFGKLCSSFLVLKRRDGLYEYNP